MIWMASLDKTVGLLVADTGPSFQLLTIFNSGFWIPYLIRHAVHNIDHHPRLPVHQDDVLADPDTHVR